MVSGNSKGNPKALQRLMTPPSGYMFAETLLVWALVLTWL